MDDNQHRIVRVWWHDAATNTGWNSNPDEITLLDITTSGFLIARDPLATKIALSWGSNGLSSDTIAIPSSQVEHMISLVPASHLTHIRRLLTEGKTKDVFILIDTILAAERKKKV